MSAPRQVLDEFSRLLDLFDERKPKRILEIGVWTGGTLAQWVGHAQDGALVVGVDLFDAPEQEGIREAVKTWRPDAEIALVQGDSTRFETITTVLNEYDEGFDWTFIDGSHDLKDVTIDWLAYGIAGTKPGGIVAFHDIAPHTRPGFASEVDQLWAEIKRWEKTEEIIASPAQGWGGIGVVYR